jgi:hypothetical protein
VRMLHEYDDGWVSFSCLNPIPSKYVLTPC